MRRSILHFAKRLWSSEDTNSRRMICDSCKNDPITRKTLCKKCIRKSTVCSTCYNQLMNTKSGDLKRRSSDKWNSSPMVHSYTESDIPNIKPFDNRTLPNTSSNTDACRSNTDKLLKLKSVNTSIEEDQSPTDTSIETYHTPICKSISFDFSFSGGIGTNNISRGKYSSSSEEYVSCSEDKIDNRTSYIQSKNSTPQGLNNQSKNSKSSLRSSKSSLRSSKHSINNSYESIASLAVSTISVEKGGISVERPKGGLTRKAFVSPVHRPSITRCNAVEIEDEEMSVVKVRVITTVYSITTLRGHKEGLVSLGQGDGLFVCFMFAYSLSSLLNRFFHLVMLPSCMSSCCEAIAMYHSTIVCHHPPYGMIITKLGPFKTSYFTTTSKA